MVIFTYRSCTTKNQRILSTSFESDFTFTPTQISIVRPQIAVQADGILCRVCAIGINFDAETGLVPTEFFRQSLKLTDRSYICSGSPVSHIGDATL